MQEQRQDGHFLAAKLIFFFHLTCQAQTQWHKEVDSPVPVLKVTLPGADSSTYTSTTLSQIISSGVPLML
jgi:hypothetical protein